MKNAEEFFKDLEIVIGYPKLLLNETLINDIYLEFHPWKKNFFNLAQELVTISKKALPGFQSSDLPKLLVDNAYFLQIDRLLGRYKVGNNTGNIKFNEYVSNLIITLI